MSEDKCTIFVNGVELAARPGQMLIEITDAADIYVPRFCYHSKLSIAANCRMCLVEVENAPKPMPACATPVTPGMKVHTRSAKAVGAQKATMEFLLINHPLDCPICDQGGECELQDLAMGFGRDISRYTERKRVVRDKNIGPLVSTDMTRCIHCTRCVRFTQEIAGFQELGTIGRGDRVEISPYIERSVNHELSGNIIDLCPVGALNSKPFRFSARAWEMVQRPAIAPHDCLGSNVYAHVMDGKVKRVVPRVAEAINETWLSDRDRFGYEGLYGDDRLTRPMLRDESGWRPVAWEEALDAAESRLRRVIERHGAESVGALVSPSATLEEGYLLGRMLERIGSANIDFRLRRRDFRGQASDPSYPALGMSIAEFEGVDQFLIVGSNLRREVPLLAHRVRKAALRGAAVHFINPVRYDYLFPVANYIEHSPADFCQELSGLVRAAAGDSALPEPVAALLREGPAPTETHQRIAGQLRDASLSVLLLGQISQRHPKLAEIEILAAELARLTNSRVSRLSEGANSAGLSLAGVLPHRTLGGRPRARSGSHAGQMGASPPRGLLLFGVEPAEDCALYNERASAGSDVDTVIAFSPYLSAWHQQFTDLVLPVATAFETPGTFVNVEGRWQSFEAAARPPGESRPGWKVLRVLAERFGLALAGHDSAEAVRDAARSLIGEPETQAPSRTTDFAPNLSKALVEIHELDVPMYRIDGMLRRAECLQKTADGRAVVTTEPAERRSA